MFVHLFLTFNNLLIFHNFTARVMIMTVVYDRPHFALLKEKIERPVDEAVISGPLDVSLALDSEWKRRYITVVGEGLYIWTNHRLNTIQLHL